MTHEFVPARIESLERLQAEMVVLPFFQDERPLRGAAGLIDWRLCGAISRTISGGYLDGRFGEKGLFAAPEGVRADALLLLGLGPSESFEESGARAACALIAEALREAQTSSVALALPGRSLERLPALRAMQIWLETEPDPGPLEDISIIEAPEEQRTLLSVVDQLRRQAESPLG